MNNVYLDLDGVINALSSKPPRQNTGWMGEWKTELIEGFRILWSTELVESLNSIASREDTEVIFLTTWRELAVPSFGPSVGLDCADWRFLGASDIELEDFSRWWKLDRIKEDLDQTNPDRVVWIDDDIRYDPMTAVWLQTQDSNLLTVCPNSNHGVTKKHIATITRHLNSEEPKTTFTIF